MRRLGPHQIDTTGATATNDSLRFDPATGRLVWVASGQASRVLVPLTTTINGVPELVWDADDSLVMTEVPR